MWPLKGRAGSCFRESLGEFWSRRNLLLATILTLNLPCFQLLGTLALNVLGQSFAFTPSPWFSVLFRNFLLPVPVDLGMFLTQSTPGLGQYIALQFFFLIPRNAAAFLMPGFAGRSIAELREHGRLEEKLSGGLAARELFWGRGAAAVFPFVMLYFAAEVVSIAFLVFVSPLPAGAPPAGPHFPDFRIFVFTLLGWVPVSFPLQTGLFLCISALSKQVRTAITWCYLLEFVIGAVISSLVYTAFWRASGSASTQMMGSLWPGVVILGLKIAVFAAVFPKAIQALRVPLGPRSPQTPAGD